MVKYVRLYRVESFYESYDRLKLIVASNPYFIKEIINVRCPLSYSRLKLPARGEKCTHLQCFEAENYFWINTKCKRWICPICMKPSYQLSVDSFMLQLLKKVNYLYPSDLGLDDLKSKKEVVELLLAEVNQIRNIDEQESITLDKNDIDTVTLNADLSITVGVRSFIANPDILDKDRQLLDFNPSYTKSKELAEQNAKAILDLRKELKIKAKQSNWAGRYYPTQIIEDAIVTLPTEEVQIQGPTMISIDEDDVVVDIACQKQIQSIPSKRRRLNPEVAIGEIIDIS